MQTPKVPYYYWSRNGTGANAWIKMLSEHYGNLAATYLQKGMKREAELFSKIAKDFSSLKQDVSEKS